MGSVLSEIGNALRIVSEIPLLGHQKPASNSAHDAWMSPMYFLMFPWGHLPNLLLCLAGFMMAKHFRQRGEVSSSTAFSCRVRFKLGNGVVPISVAKDAITRSTVSLNIGRVKSTPPSPPGPFNKKPDIGGMPGSTAYMHTLGGARANGQAKSTISRDENQAVMQRRLSPIPQHSNPATCYSLIEMSGICAY